MILQCPDCMARYVVPDQSIPKAGRTVRCAKCRHTWFHKNESSQEENEVLSDLNKLLDEINSRPKGLAKGANLPALRGQATKGQKIATLLSLAAATAASLAVFYPALISLPPSKGLILAEVGFTKSEDAEKKSYSLTGKISNITGQIVPVPNLRITLVDDLGATLQYWDFGSGNEPPIGPWNKLPFDTGAMEQKISKGTRLVLEIGSPLELALRSKAGVAPLQTTPVPDSPAGS